MLPGVSAGSDFHSGSAETTAAMVSVAVGRPKGEEPDNISKSTHPKAQMSVRLSTAWPRACSGLMYDAVPRITPAVVLAPVMVGDLDSSGLEPSAARALARPKSSTLTIP